MPVQISQLHVSNIGFGKLDDNSRTPSPNITFITYVDDTTRLNVITPEFITETYGIPCEGPYYKTDRSRAFFNMPFLSRPQEVQRRDILRRDRGSTQQAPGDRRLLGQQRIQIAVIRRETPINANIIRSSMKASSGNEKKQYGIVLKAIAIERSNKTVPKSNPVIDLFDDDE